MGATRAKKASLSGKQRSTAKARATAAPKRAVTKLKAKAQAVPKRAVTKPEAKAKPKRTARPKPKLTRAPSLEAKRTTTAIHHEVDLPADPMVVWTCLIDPARHSDFTGGEATGAPKVGAIFTAWDGYIRGVHRELVPGTRIVQSWSTSEWPDGAPPSRLEITLAKTRAGTRLTMMQTDVPSDQAAAYSEGWTTHYWEPLAAYLARGA